MNDDVTPMPAKRTHQLRSSQLKKFEKSSTMRSEIRANERKTRTVLAGQLGWKIGLDVLPSALELDDTLPLLLKHATRRGLGLFNTDTLRVGRCSRGPDAFSQLGAVGGHWWCYDSRRK